MSSRRVRKVAEAIREVVAMAILTDLNDPRIEDVTVTFVEVAGDLRLAKVHVSVMGDETKQNLCIHGLRSAAGYLQQRVSNRVDLRYTPTLKFVLDKGIKNAFEVTRILDEVLPPKSDSVKSPEMGSRKNDGENQEDEENQPAEPQAPEAEPQA